MTVAALLGDIVEEAGWPGLTAAIAWPNGDLLTGAAGFADRDAGRPMQAGDRMLAGSVGKTFAAAMALTLADSGAIALDEPITRFAHVLPWIQTLPNTDDLTLRRLLAHRSGLADFIYTPGWMSRWAAEAAANPDDAPSVEDCIRVAAEAGPLGAADVETAYADTNFLIVGRLIEAASGESYYPRLQRLVLGPLGLKATSPSTSRRIPGLVPGYPSERFARLWGPGTLGQDGALVYNPAWEFTGGGLVSTPADLVRFMSALFGGDIVGPEMLREMLGSWPMEYPLPSHRYGLGLQRFESELGPTSGHSGQFPGYRTLAFHFHASGISVAMQVNADAEGLMPRFLNIAAHAHRHPGRVAANA